MGANFDLALPVPESMYAKKLMSAKFLRVFYVSTIKFCEELQTDLLYFVILFSRKEEDSDIGLASEKYNKDR